MKRFFTSFLFSISLLLIHHTVYSQWTRCKGPYSGIDIRNFTTDGIRIYIGGANNLLYYSGDSGNSWEDVTNELNLYKTTSLLLHRNYLYEGTEMDGLFRSSDFGKSWEYIGYKGYEINKLCKYQNTVLASVCNVGLVISSNDGKSWEPIPNLPSDCRYNVQTNTNSIFVDDGTDLLRSGDNGLSWKKMNISDGSIFDDFITRYTVNGNSIIAEYISGTYYSSNNGDSWKKIGDKDFLPSNISFAYVEGRNIYRGLESGVQKTNTNSSEWTSITDKIGYINPIALQYELGTWYLIAKQGLFLSKTNETSWKLSGIPSLFISKMISFRDKLFIGTNAGLFVSADKGNTWQESNGLSHMVYDFATMDTSLYVATSGGVFEIVEGVDYFEKHVIQGMSIYGLLTIDSTLYAVMDDMIQYTSDKGKKWELSIKTNRYITHADVGNKTLFVSTRDNRSFRSTDGGKKWDELSLTGEIFDFEIVGDDIYAAGKNGISKSTDNGTNWFSVTSGIPAAKYSTLLSDKNGFVYAGTEEGIFVTENNGATWNKLDDNFPYYKTSIYMDDGTLYVGARNQGLWKYELNMSTIRNNINTEEEQIRIYCDNKNDLLNIEINSESNMNTYRGMVCDIMSIDGRVIFSAYLSASTSSIPLTGFNTGAYIISIHSEHQSHRSLIHILR